jgi:hypothetical protein
VGLASAWSAAPDAFDLVVEATYPLAEALAALEHAARPGALKVLLRP